MAFTVKPFAEMIALTKEKFDEALAPMRAKAAKAKADLESAKLEEMLVTLEREITEKCASKDIDFHEVVALIDKYELTERKRGQINNLIAGLFPAK